MKHYIAVCVQSTNDSGTEVNTWLEYHFEGPDSDGKIRALIGGDITGELNKQEKVHATVHDAADGNHAEAHH